jgi:hypothetical protein
MRPVDEAAAIGNLGAARDHPGHPGPRRRHRARLGRRYGLLPAKGIWSVLKRGVLANLAVASFGHLVQVIRHGLKKIQYRPGLIEGCLAGTGLKLEPGETSTDITN